MALGTGVWGTQKGQWYGFWSLLTASLLYVVTAQQKIQVQSCSRDQSPRPSVSTRLWGAYEGVISTIKCC